MWSATACNAWALAAVVQGVDDEQRERLEEWQWREEEERELRQLSKLTGIQLNSDEDAEMLLQFIRGHVGEADFRMVCAATLSDASVEEIDQFLEDLGTLTDDDLPRLAELKDFDDDDRGPPPDDTERFSFTCDDEGRIWLECDGQTFRVRTHKKMLERLWMARAL